MAAARPILRLWNYAAGVRPQFRNIAIAAKPPPVAAHKGKPIVTLIPGDGVGPELVYAVQEVFKTVGIPVDFEEIFISEVHHSRSASVETVVNSVKRNNGVALKGAIRSGYTTQGELEPLNVKLRRALDLFAKVCHIKTLKGIKTRHKDLDFVIVREQTEGEYSALEHECVPGVVENLKIMTRDKCLRVAKFAFDYATKHGRSKVTAVHKANIMKLGDGLFLNICHEISKLYPKIEFNNMIIDNCCMQLVAKPEQFDVMVMPNLYGNIIDNLGAGLVGGPGVVTGENYGMECVVFEPGSRHVFQSAMGKDIANPTAMFLCAANMLEHIHLEEYAVPLRKAVEKVIADGKIRTRDLGGQATTTEFTGAVMNNIKI